MHKALERFLKKNGLNPDRVPDEKRWHLLLEYLDKVYRNNDEDRYLLERSLEISSREMQEVLENSRADHRRRITALLTAIPDLMFYLDEEGRVLDIFASGKEEQLGRPKEEMTGRLMSSVFEPDRDGLLTEANRAAIEEGRLNIYDYVVSGDGGRKYFEARFVPTDIVENGKRTSIAILRDITAQRKSMEYLGVIKKIFEDATEGILIASFAGDFFEVNDAFCSMCGLDRKNLPGRQLEDYKRFFEPEVFETVAETVRSKGYYYGEVKLKRDDGSELLVWLTLDTVYDESGAQTYKVVMLTDISALQESREKLYYTATHDALTGLPNRRMLFEHMAEAVDRTKRNRHSGAVFFIDLDNFKHINDMLGHEAGDYVLKECARRISAVIRKTDMLGRLGGDEFLLIAEDIKSPNTPAYLAKKILDVINRPYFVGDIEYSLGASIGISIFPDESEAPGELLKHADRAMYIAKEEGKNRFHFYATDLDVDVKRRNAVERALKNALASNTLYLAFQPRIDLVSARITGVEVLLRVNDETLGPVSPAEFIPIAEESDMIIRLGKWVLESACRQMREWIGENLVDESDFKISINLSYSQLLDEGWSDFVGRTLARYGIEPSVVEFELSEMSFMNAEKSGNKTLKKLIEMGCGLSIDDFGTGYSSIPGLKTLSVERLKIDRSFVGGLVLDNTKRSIVRASIALAHAMGFSTVAEGVETAEQREAVRAMGCNEMQGFLFSPPRDAKEIGALLVRRCPAEKS